MRIGMTQRTGITIVFCIYIAAVITLSTVILSSESVHGSSITYKISGTTSLSSLQNYPYDKPQCCGKTNYYQYSASQISGSIQGTGSDYTTFSYYADGSINFTSWNLMNVSFGSRSGTLTCYEFGHGSNSTDPYFESYQSCGAGTSGLIGFRVDVFMYNQYYWGNVTVN